MRSLTMLSILIVAGLVVGGQPAQGSGFGQDNSMEFNEALDLDEEAQAEYQARDAAAEANFDAIMLPQNAKAPAASAPPRQMNRSRRQMQQHIQDQGVLNALGNMDSASDMPVGVPGGLVVPSVEQPEVEMPLSVYATLRKQVQALRELAARQAGPAVVLGAAAYSGQAIPGALELDLELKVTLGRPDKWKTVPLVGDDAVLVNTLVDGKPVPISRRNGYHVWVTKRTGEATVQVKLLVAQRGPRGSIEYDFLVARTPVTSFACVFPVEDLEPRINAAVRAQFSPQAGGTLVTATLRPTTRIHLLGLKDIGEQEGRQAKVYAESLNLLSVDQDSLELFAVFRYTILYAGTKEFSILVPPGMEVVSADGMGAFRYTEQPADGGGVLLKGETAFPIRNKYEISLRLRRKLAKKGEAFSAPLPRCQGVERETGWLAVEVPGKLQLEEKSRSGAKIVNTPQLPEEMVRSAVSPILKAYRYHTGATQVQLVATELPEIEPKSASVDRIRAFTKLTREGDLITDLRITLRNRLRPHLALELPEGSKISSALLDGSPFNPSKDEQGKILLPLKRSGGGDRLRPFTVSVVVESKLDPMGWFGESELHLPAVDLPVSTLNWTVYLPPQNIYSALEGEFEPQQYMGRASWYQPVYRPQAGMGPGSPNFNPTIGHDRPTASADAGAMPVRFKIPTDGTQLDHQQYWIEADKSVEVELHYLRSWLRYPAWMFMSLLLGVGMLLFSLRFGPQPRRLISWLGLGLIVIAWATGSWIGGSDAVGLGLLLGLVATTIHRRWLRSGLEKIKDWGTSLLGRFRSRDRDPSDWMGWPLFRRIVATVGLIFFGLLLIDAALEFSLLLLFPLP